VLSLAVIVLVLVRKTLESIKGDLLFKEAGTSVFVPYVDYIPTLPFE
jgi:hypothetical protein